MTFPRHTLTRDPCFARGGTLFVRAPFIQFPSGRTEGQGGGFSLTGPSPEEIAAEFSPRGATDGGGVSHHSASPVHIDTESEPGSWVEALPYKFRETLAQQIDRDLSARKRVRLARRK